MTKNISLEIKALENGYLVERSWQELKPSVDDPFDYTYKSKKWMFTDWTAVLEWVKNNELEVPPAE